MNFSVPFMQSRSYLSDDPEDSESSEIKDSYKIYCQILSDFSSNDKQKISDALTLFLRQIQLEMEPSFMSDVLVNVSRLDNPGIQIRAINALSYILSTQLSKSFIPFLSRCIKIPYLQSTILKCLSTFPSIDFFRSISPTITKILDSGAPLLRRSALCSVFNVARLSDCGNKIRSFVISSASKMLFEKENCQVALSVLSELCLILEKSYFLHLLPTFLSLLPHSDLYSLSHLCILLSELGPYDEQTEEEILKQLLLALGNEPPFDRAYPVALLARKFHNGRAIASITGAWMEQALFYTTSSTYFLLATKAFGSISQWFHPQQRTLARISLSQDPLVRAEITLSQAMEIQKNQAINNPLFVSQMPVQKIQQSDVEEKVNSLLKNQKQKVIQRNDIRNIFESTNRDLPSLVKPKINAMKTPETNFVMVDQTQSFPPQEMLRRAGMELLGQSYVIQHPDLLLNVLQLIPPKGTWYVSTLFNLHQHANGSVKIHKLLASCVQNIKDPVTIQILVSEANDFLPDISDDYFGNALSWLISQNADDQNILPYIVPANVGKKSLEFQMSAIDSAMAFVCRTLQVPSEPFLNRIKFLNFSEARGVRQRASELINLVQALQ